MRPVVAAIDMGYGHLRPAAALAAELGVSVLEIDRPPLGSEVDARFWATSRKLYEPITRWSQRRLGTPMRLLLNTVTAIPAPWPFRDLSGPTAGTRWLLRAARDGVGRGLVSDAPLLTTYFAAAILAELHGATDVSCVVTDSDVNRVWAPPSPQASQIRYFAPSERVVRRLQMYGVSEKKIFFSGFPLPGELVGRDGAALRANLTARLSRLGARGAVRTLVERDLGPLPPASGPPLVVFAVGGAGAQVPLAQRLIRGLQPALRAGKLRLTLVAGRRAEVASALRAAAPPGVEVLYEPDVFAYFRRFNALLANADVLWSKPSEMTFFAALGLPFVAAPPVGVHEEWNLRWATDRGAALSQHDPLHAGDWLTEWIDDGVLAAAAWSGYTRLPSGGLYQIADAVSHGRR